MQGRNVNHEAGKEGGGLQIPPFQWQKTKRRHRIAGTLLDFIFKDKMPWRTAFAPSR